MAENRQNPQDELNSIDDVEIEPLSDEALEDVAGGLATAGSTNCCSCSQCSMSPTSPSEPAPTSPIKVAPTT